MDDDTKETIAFLREELKSVNALENWGATLVTPPHGIFH
jgi:hypothetical protein